MSCRIPVVIFKRGQRKKSRITSVASRCGLNSNVSPSTAGRDTRPRRANRANWYFSVRWSIAGNRTIPWRHFVPPEHRFRSNLIEPFGVRPWVEAPESTALSGNTNIIQKGYHNVTKATFRSSGSAETRNEMKQVRVKGAEFYGTRHT